MKRIGFSLVLSLAIFGVAHAEDLWDNVDSALSFSGFNDSVRAHLSGTFDLEQYSFQQPAPGLLYTAADELTIPRLTLFLDTQIGPRVYGFVQFRADRGFDPGDGSLRGRLDEYALRFNFWDEGRLNLQIGKFGSVVGNWIRRHGSWTDPFITAPLLYDNLTGIEDIVAFRSAQALLTMSNAWPTPGWPEWDNKLWRLPAIWGPSYTEGAALTGKLGDFDLAVEMKSSSLSSEPSTWQNSNIEWNHPTFSGELSYKPTPMWNIGLSASSGSYLLPLAYDTTAPGYSIGSYRENVLGQDLEFSWHHVQIWAEAYEVRFQIPTVGNADLLGYYIESKYKFTPQFSAAIRWNQETYGDIFVPGLGETRWGRNTWRIDFAPSYRFTAHTQLKLQYSLQAGEIFSHRFQHVLAVQFTQKF